MNMILYVMLLISGKNQFVCLCECDMRSIKEVCDHFVMSCIAEQILRTFLAIVKNSMSALGMCFISMMSHRNITRPLSMSAGSTNMAQMQTLEPFLTRPGQSIILQSKEKVIILDDIVIV